VEIYAECEGFVDCKGDVLIVKKNQKGTIFFKGEEIKEVEKLTLFTKNFKKVLQ
jgi:septum site-determining protein MinC